MAFLEKSVSVIPALFLVLTILSGCSGKGGSQTTTGGEDAIPPTAQPGEFDDSTCAIQGFVVDDEFNLVPGAEVGLFGTDIPTALSAADGGFSFSFLPPTDYQLVASKLGYDPVTERVPCPVGTMVEGIELQLVSVPDPQVAYYEALPVLNGFIGCAVGFVTVGTLDACASQYPDSQTAFSVQPDNATITGAVFEMAWTPTSGLFGGAVLQFNVPHPRDVIEHTFTTDDLYDPNQNELRGPSVLNILYESKSVEESLYPTTGGLLQLSARASSNSDATALVNSPNNHGNSMVVMEQKFDIYVSFFYNGFPVPEGYTATPT